MAQIIKTSGEVVEKSPKNGTDFQLDEVKDVVGGWVEAINLRDGRLMLCDEEGKLKNKPVNIKATTIFHGAFRTSDFIVGDVLVCKEDELK